MTAKSHTTPLLETDSDQSVKMRPKIVGAETMGH